MLKTLRDMLIGAIVTAAVSSAFAVVGVAPLPGSGPALVDGTWLNGLANGQNRSFQSGLTALGTTQATALQLNAGVALLQVDTTAASTGVAMPTCLAGTWTHVYNNGASTLTVYPAILNNPITAAQDTINNATSITLATHVGAEFSCAKNGVWSSP